MAAVERAYEWLSAGHRIRKMKMTEDEREHLRDLHLLTMKPLLYVANVDEADIGRQLAEVDGLVPVPICAEIEAEMAQLAPDELAEYLEMEGLAEPGLAVLIREAYAVLGLQSFFTHGPNEVRAWTVPVGATAYDAAGEIHTDFQRGFIKADVISYADFDKLGSEAAAKAAGKLRHEGRDYVLADGDLVLFRFNV